MSPKEIRVTEAQRLEANMFLDKASERYRSAAMNDLMRGGPEERGARDNLLNDLGLVIEEPEEEPEEADEDAD